MLMIYVVGAIVLVLLIAVMAYISTRYYEGRYDRTYMTQDERGFRRGLKGKTAREVRHSHTRRVETAGSPTPDIPPRRACDPSPRDRG